MRFPLLMLYVHIIFIDRLIDRLGPVGLVLLMLRPPQYHYKSLQLVLAPIDIDICSFVYICPKCMG